MSIDLNNPPKGHNLRVEIDKEETEDERKVRLFKDKTLFLFALALICVIFAVCICEIVWSSNSDTQKVAWSLVTAIIGGLLGFLVGKK